MGDRKKSRTRTPHTAPLADAPEEQRQAGPWRVRYVSGVRDTDLKVLSTSSAEAARKAIDKKLKVDPQQYGEFLHRPLQGLYKLKTSAVRIVYHVDPEAHEVWVLAIGERRDIWSDQAGILKRLDVARGEFLPDDVPMRRDPTTRDR